MKEAIQKRCPTFPGRAPFPDDDPPPSEAPQEAVEEGGNGMLNKEHPPSNTAPIEKLSRPRRIAGKPAQYPGQECRLVDYHIPIYPAILV